MRRLLLAAIPIVATVIGVALPVSAAPPTPSGTISINEPGPYAIDDVVTFTTTVDNLKGSQWPMVLVECVSDLDGGVLYGQLDYPNVGFVLGGGSSPWRDASNVGENATCTGTLYAYSKHGAAGTFLAETGAFPVSGS